MADLHETLETPATDLNAIPIHTLGSEHVAVLKPFSVVIQRDGEEFMATWVEANIGTGGETLVAAVANLQSLIGEIFLDLVDTRRKHSDQA